MKSVAVQNRRLLALAAIAFCALGVFIAGTHAFQKAGGRQLAKAAPVVRRVLPNSVKGILADLRDRLPIYGPTPVWLARKVGSIFYFGIVSLFVLFLRRRHPVTLVGILAVTVGAAMGMSAVIEAFEFPEEIDDVVLDLTCGAIGGCGAGLLAAWWLRRSRSKRTDAVG